MDKEVQSSFFLVLVIISFAEANLYCTIRNCPKDMHTLCKFPEFKPARACGIIVRPGLNQNEIDTIVELHNYYRRYVYSGNETRGYPGPLPVALYFQDLSWDEELAAVAQAWAEQCELYHDECRNVDRWVVGQNFGFEFEPVGVNPEVFKVDLIIRKWYEEVQRFNTSQIYMYNREVARKTKTYRFSQMIWQYTKKIGCGSMRYFDGTFARIFLVCNYGHKGNYPGKQIYLLKR